MELTSETVDFDLLNTGLERVNNVGQYPLLIALSSSFMRGIDYRSRRAGISLLVARSFPDKRAQLQAAARVGRNGDVATRWMDLAAIAETETRIRKSRRELKAQCEKVMKQAKDAAKKMN